MRSRIFLLTYTAGNMGLILYGFMALIQPAILLDPFFEHVYQFPAEAANAAAYLASLFRLLGYFNIIPGALGLVLLHRYWVTQQRWYLKVVVASTIFAYLGPVIFDNTAGTIGFFEILEHILFVMILIFGFLELKYGGNGDYQRIPSSQGGQAASKETMSGFLTQQDPKSGLNLISER